MPSELGCLKVEVLLRDKPPAQDWPPDIVLQVLLQALCMRLCQLWHTELYPKHLSKSTQVVRVTRPPMKGCPLPDAEVSLLL